MMQNIRETYIHPDANYKECVERTQYYPSGLPWAERLSDSFTAHPWKYNGKEFVEMHGLDEYDSKARWYYPAICRTTTMDPLAEKYYPTSPYAWCGNNPVRFVDPDGRGPKDRIILAQEWVNLNVPYKQELNTSPNYLRTNTSPEALAFMDCSEFVCRIIAADCITPTIESHSTKDMLLNMMSDETKFIKSDIPQVGDIVLWEGHTGIVEGYNESNDMVTVLHATQYGPITDTNGRITSYKANSTRRETYSLNKYYRNKKNAFFYRPVNETPDVFVNSSTVKLPEVIIKPSKED